MIQANNNFGNSPQEKSNWKIGKMFGKCTTDVTKAAVLEIGLYKSPYSIFGTFSIRNEMGKDAKGRIQLETGLNKDNPSVLLNPENLSAFLAVCERLEREPEKVSQLNYHLDAGKSKLDVVGSETKTLLTVTNEIGSKSIQFDATPAGFANIHACFSALKNFLKIVQKKQLSAKLDPEEFGTNNDNNDEDTPF